MDYNPSINGFDYVSYLANNVITYGQNVPWNAIGFIPGGYIYYIPTIEEKSVKWRTKGMRLWSREMNDNGHLVYSALGETTFEDYVNAFQTAFPDRFSVE